MSLGYIWVRDKLINEASFKNVKSFFFFLSFENTGLLNESNKRKHIHRGVTSSLL